MSAGIGRIRTEAALERFIADRVTPDRVLTGRVSALELAIAFEDVHEVGDVGEPAFQNGWLAHATYTPPRFYMEPSGLVRIEGCARDGANGAVAFTLPAGYRPSAVMVCGNVAWNAGLVLASVHIAANGQVSPRSADGSVGEVWINAAFRPV